MADDKAMRTSAKSSICYQGYSFPKSGTNNCRCWFQHLRHTRCTLWANVADHYNITRPDLARINPFDQFEFPIEHPGRSNKTLAFFASYFCNTSTLGQVAI